MLGEFQAGRADLFLRGQPTGIVESWLQASLPFKSENIVIVQAIQHQESLKVFDLSRNFVEFSSEIIYSYAISLVAIALFSFFLSGFRRRNMNSGIVQLEEDSNQKRTFDWFHFNVNSFLTFLFLKNRLTSFRVFSLFMSLFFWQSLLFLTNNIKTKKVVLGKGSCDLSGFKLVFLILPDFLHPMKTHRF